MSVRDQERQARQAERRISEAMRRADRDVGKKIEARAHEASLRANEVKRRIERGDVEPRPLPGLREDSMASMESMPSMESSPSMKSIESADYARGVSEEALQAVETGDVMMKDMPLEGTGMDPEAAHEDLAQRVTEETGSGGDPHKHAERKADEIAGQITEDTGAEGDMQVHAERKVEQMGQEMFED
ncbi:MAG TPA: hypothetical protein VF068_12875 [Rubrobacter sp.]